MKLYILAFALTLFIAGCNNNKENVDNESDKDTTIIIHENKNSEPQPQPKPQPDPQPQPETKPDPKTVYQPLMDEYHQILCRRNKGNPQPNDGIRQIELTKKLNDIRDGLSKDDRFEFTTSMARAANMADCP